MTFSFAMIWPLALVICSNVLYNVCTKSVPDTMDPMASLTVTYLVGAAVSAALYFLLNRGGDLLREYTKLNWAPVILGVVIVGLEVGYIYAYKAGWTISTASLVQSAIVAVALLTVGVLAYKEALTVSKVLGVVICLVGLFFLNR